MRKIRGRRGILAVDEFNAANAVFSQTGLLNTNPDPTLTLGLQKISWDAGTADRQLNTSLTGAHAQLYKARV